MIYARPVPQVASLWSIVLWLPFLGTPLRADLVTHYDAIQLTGFADGQEVPLWPDSSGQGNDAVKSASAASPAVYQSSGIGGVPSLRFSRSGGFSGSGDGYASILSMGTAFGIEGDAGWTFILVARFESRTPSGNVQWLASLGSGFGTNPSAALIEIDGVAGGRLDIAGGFSHDVALAPNGSFDNQFLNEDIILTVTHAANTGTSFFDSTTIHINGFAPGEGILAGNSLIPTGVAGTAMLTLANASLTVGGSAQHGTGGGLNGLIAEVLVFDEPLTPQQRANVEFVLSRKYSIPGNFIPEPSTCVLLLVTGALCTVIKFANQASRNRGG